MDYATGTFPTFQYVGKALLYNRLAAAGVLGYHHAITPTTAEAYMLDLTLSRREV